MIQRALDRDDKQARRAAILAAARGLFLQDSRNLPAAAQIAAAAGLAKGTVYLYFRSKEEIFVALLNEDFAGLFDTVAQAFAEPGGAPLPRMLAFLQQYVAYLDAHPELLRLDAMAYSLLEQKLGAEQLRGFKLALVQRLVSAGNLLERALSLPAGQGTTLLLRTYALTRGLWQALDYPDNLRTLLADPVFAPIRPDFRSELIAALAEYWRGALTGQPLD